MWGTKRDRQADPPPAGPRRAVSSQPASFKAAPTKPKAGTAVSRRQVLTGASAGMLSTAALTLPGTTALAVDDPTSNLAAIPNFSLTAAYLETVLRSLRVVTDAKPGTTANAATAAPGDYVTFGFLPPIPGQAEVAAAHALVQSIPPQLVTWAFQRQKADSSWEAFSPTVPGLPFGPALTALFPFAVGADGTPSVAPTTKYRAQVTIGSVPLTSGPLNQMTPQATAPVTLPGNGQWFELSVTGLARDEVVALVKEAFKLETPKLQVAPGVPVPLAVVPKGPEDLEWVVKTAEMVKPKFDINIDLPLDDVFKPIKAITGVGTRLLDFAIGKVTLVTGLLGKITGTALGGIGLGVTGTMKIASQALGFGAKMIAELVSVGGTIGRFLTGRRNKAGDVRKQILQGGREAERVITEGVDVLSGIVRDVDRTIDELLDVSALQNLTGLLDGAFSNLSIPLAGSILNENFTTGLIRPEDDDPTYKARKALPTIPSLAKQADALGGLPPTASFLRIGNAILPITLSAIGWPAGNDALTGLFYADRVADPTTALSRTLAFIPPAKSTLRQADGTPIDTVLGPLRQRLAVTLTIGIHPVQTEQDQRKLGNALVALVPASARTLPPVDLETTLTLLPFDYEALLSRQVEITVPVAAVPPGGTLPIQLGASDLTTLDATTVGTRRSVGILTLDVTATPTVSVAKVDGTSAGATVTSRSPLDLLVTAPPPTPAYASSSSTSKALPAKASEQLLAVRVSVAFDLTWSV